jgi:hypothetical protein
VQMVSVQALQEAPVSTSTVHDILIPFYANLYGVSTDTMDYIVSHESGYGEYQVGDHGTSLGLVQIHLPAHPNITAQEAYNPFYALNFLALSLRQGRCSMWSTCPLADNAP